MSCPESAQPKGACAGATHATEGDNIRDPLRSRAEIDYSTNRQSLFWGAGLFRYWS